MTVRWDRLPDKAKPAKPPKVRRPTAMTRYRCVGIAGCGAVRSESVAAMERHLDGHAAVTGGARAEMCAGLGNE